MEDLYQTLAASLIKQISGFLFHTTCVCVCVFAVILNTDMLRIWKFKIIGSCRLESNLIDFLSISTLLWLMSLYPCSFILSLYKQDTCRDFSVCI